MKKFDVYIYHSGYSYHQVEAENAEDAIAKARELPLKKDDILSSLEPWEEADEANEVKNKEADDGKERAD